MEHPDKPRYIDAIRRVEKVIDIVQPRQAQDALLVGHRREDGVRSTGDCYGGQPQGLQRSTVGGMPLLRIVEQHFSVIPPGPGRPVAKRGREIRDRQLASQADAFGKLGQQQVARDPGNVEHQWLDLEDTVF